MRVGVTGASGFLGWHIRTRLLAMGIEHVPATRETITNPSLLDEFVRSCDVIVHAAGVNRATTDDAIWSGNCEPATALVAALQRSAVVTPLVYLNSLHASGDSAYGLAKKQAGNILEEHQHRIGAPLLDLVLPHVFGEYGKPHYNSAAATFAHCLAVGQEPSLNRPGELELLHSQEVAAECVRFIAEPVSATRQMQGTRTTVGAIWDTMREQHARYVDEFTIPSFASLLELQLFNMLRSHLYVNGFYPRSLELHRDERGCFMEACRADGPGQTSISTTEPGITRGDHYHIEKIERFVVVSGNATIRLRRLLTADCSTFVVSGDEPVYVDMPPLTTHNITNTGDDQLTTLFWAGDHFDPAEPDTYLDPVEQVLAPGAT